MPRRSRKTAKLLTLSEVSKKAGISMPSLLVYKKEFQGRIPAVGKGRSQRYPEAAIAVFQEIKRERMAKRAGPKSTGRSESTSMTGSREGRGRVAAGRGANGAVASRLARIERAQAGLVSCR